MWSKGQTLINHSELIIGRMYRKFLYDGRLKIDFTIINENKLLESPVHHFALPNDPLYLMENTSCPPPFNNKPMFEPWFGLDNYEETFDVTLADGETHQIIVRYSNATDEARTTIKGEGHAGSKPYG